VILAAGNHTHSFLHLHHCQGGGGGYPSKHQRKDSVDPLWGGMMDAPRGKQLKEAGSKTETIQGTAAMKKETMINDNDHPGN
jgi:hypothetical protein